MQSRPLAAGSAEDSSVHCSLSHGRDQSSNAAKPVWQERDARTGIMMQYGSKNLVP